MPWVSGHFRNGRPVRGHYRRDNSSGSGIGYLIGLIIIGCLFFEKFRHYFFIIILVVGGLIAGYYFLKYLSKQDWSDAEMFPEENTPDVKQNISTETKEQSEWKSTSRGIRYRINGTTETTSKIANKQNGVAIGTIHKVGDVEYIKTKDGWRYHN